MPLSKTIRQLTEIQDRINSKSLAFRHKHVFLSTKTKIFTSSCVRELITLNWVIDCLEGERGLTWIKY